jgi:Protein of unknown function (DUF2946)
MMFSRLFRRSAALAATAAIALQAFWPLLAQARPRDATLPVVLCSVDGATHGREIGIGKSTPLEERSASHGEHCKLCVFGDGKTVLNTAVDAVSTPRVSSCKVLKPESSFREQLPLLSASPRAPPQAS